MPLIFPRRRVLQAAVAAVFAVAATTTGAATATAEGTLERIKKQGVVRIGFANEAPFGYATPDGKLTGEAPEVAKAVLARMGIAEVDGVLTEFGSLIPGLQAGRFDIIAAGMFITPQRCGQILFSEPSYGIGQAFLVPSGNPKSIRDYATIAEDESLKLAVLAGAVEAGYARDAGVSRGQLLMLPDQASLLKAVQAGRAHAAALTALSVANLVDKADGVEATQPFGTVAGRSVKGHGGFGFRKQDEDLHAAFNQHLTAFLGTPEHIALVTPFGFGEGFLPNLTTDELCAGD